jgi:hypothetical protein
MRSKIATSNEYNKIRGRKQVRGGQEWGLRGKQVRKGEGLAVEDRVGGLSRVRNSRTTEMECARAY